MRRLPKSGANVSEASRIRTIVAADSDSYLKWGAARIADMPPSWDARLVIIRSAVTPSPQQVREASGAIEPGGPIAFDAFMREITSDPPDVLVLACRGPLIALITRRLSNWVGTTPVLVTGIAGMWYPPTDLGIQLRTGADVLVTHSRREARAVHDRALALGMSVGLASLFPLTTAHRGPKSEAKSLIFATQALVPRDKADRVRLAHGLCEVARRNPELEVVVKVRGERGEAQTHADEFPLPELFEALGVDLPPNLVVRRGPMEEHLRVARGLVTVSSTAAVEALAMGVPVALVNDFGVSEENLNEVFTSSGLLRSLSDIADMRLGEANPEWAAENYLHPREESNWTQVVGARLASAERAVRGQREAVRAPSWWRHTRYTAAALGDSSPMWVRAAVWGTRRLRSIARPRQSRTDRA
jgi:hypothetical protein